MMNRYSGRCGALPEDPTARIPSASPDEVRRLSQRPSRDRFDLRDERLAMTVDVAAQPDLIEPEQEKQPAPKRTPRKAARPTRRTASEMERVVRGVVAEELKRVLPRMRRRSC